MQIHIWRLNQGLLVCLGVYNEACCLSPLEALADWVKTHPNMKGKEEELFATRGDIYQLQP